MLGWIVGLDMVWISADANLLVLFFFCGIHHGVPGVLLVYTDVVVCFCDSWCTPRYAGEDGRGRDVVLSSKGN